jgi:hypothetical protein
MGRAIVVFILLACAATALFWMRSAPPPPPTTVVVTPAPSPEPKSTPPVEIESTKPAAPQFVEFTSNEMTDKMVLEVGRMVRPNRVIAGIESTKTGRVAFVVVDGEGRLYDMEQDLLPQYEAVMKELGLSPATGISTRVLSRYRSVSKTAMTFDEQKDRMVVIVTPSAEWSKFRLPKPVAPPPLKPEN